jgi:uncharacterized protein
VTRLRVILIALFILLLAPATAGAETFEVPTLRSAVNDEAGILSPATRQRLEAALRELHRAGGTQLAILTVPSLGDLTIEQASIRVVDAWQLGSAEADDGVLLLVAPNERRVRIEVGQGLEGVLPDAWAKRIVDEAIAPLFRTGDMDGGVTVGVYQIARRTNPDVDLAPILEGSLRAPPAPSRRGASLLRTVFILLVVALVLSVRMGWLPFLLMGGATRHGRWGSAGGFGGGGFGGGGFSGGGGGFSGGGASGGW